MYPVSYNKNRKIIEFVTLILMTLQRTVTSYKSVQIQSLVF